MEKIHCHVRFTSYNQVESEIWKNLMAFREPSDELDSQKATDRFVDNFKVESDHKCESTRYPDWTLTPFTLSLLTTLGSRMLLPAHVGPEDLWD